MQTVIDLKLFSPKWDVSIMPLPSEFRGPHGRGRRMSLRARGDTGHKKKKKQDLLNQLHRSTYELRDTKAACTGPEWVCNSWSLRAQRRGGYIPNPEAIANR